MKQNKKLLSLVMFILMFVFTSCSALEHINIIKNISDNNVLVEDVKTHKERIVIISKTKSHKILLEFSHIGDTVIVQSPYYEDLVLQTGARTHVFFNFDSINSRINEHCFIKKKQELFTDKVR
jgi:hypothetical protein